MAVSLWTVEIGNSISFNIIIKILLPFPPPNSLIYPLLTFFLNSWPNPPLYCSDNLLLSDFFYLMTIVTHLLILTKSWHNSLFFLLLQTRKIKALGTLCCASQNGQGWVLLSVLFPILFFVWNSWHFSPYHTFLKLY